jgi:hypothetical protein
VVVANLRRSKKPPTKIDHDASSRYSDVAEDGFTCGRRLGGSAQSPSPPHGGVVSGDAR